MQGLIQQEYREAIKQNLATLPLLPSVISKLMVIHPDDDNFLDEVYKVARQDPTFSIRLIQHATKTLGYGAHVKEITNLKHAMARLGGWEITSILIYMSMMDAFTPKCQSDNNLWIHSVQVAVAAKHLASMMPELNLDPDHLYLAGLLHDIGRFIIFQAVPEGPSRIDEAGWLDPTTLLTSELKTCGIDHVDVGVQACEKWLIPSSIIKIISNHHKSGLPFESPEEQSLCKRICLIQVADSLSVWLMKQPYKEVEEGDVEALKKIQEKYMEQLNELIAGSCNCIPKKYNSMLSEKLILKSDAILTESDRLLSGLGFEL